MLNKDKSAFVTLLVLSFCGLVLGLRLFYLQIIKGAEYQQLSDNIRARVITKIAPRGFIYDRQGKVLAESKILYDLYLLPYQSKEPGKEFKFLQSLNIDCQKAWQKYRQKNYLPFEPLLIKKNLNPAELSYLEENRELLPGVMISSRIIRNYPYGKTCAHVLGYVGEINSVELENLKNYGYKLGDIIGLAGVERYYDQYLKGVNGGEPLEVDPLGNPVRKLVSQEPVPGADIYLTIDLDLQQELERVFADRKGAAVALDPRTGEVLAMISKPDYNPNYFTDFLTEKEWKEIISAEHPLHNRALTGYPPGSVFKIVTSLAALEMPSFNPNQYYYCPGYMLMGRRFNCWVASGHGRLNFYDGFRQSCNIVFYNLGLLLGPERIARAATNFGLGFTTNLDLPFESAGLIPTQKWKKKAYKEDWFPGDSMNMAIGQGFDLVSPLQMSIVVATVANPEHVLLRPFLVKKIISSEDKLILEKEKEIVGYPDFHSKNLETIRRLMYDVVQKGTGRKAQVKGLAIAGKTGTAEIVRDKKTHAWFVSFSPVDKPEIVLVIFVESGGFGGEVAATMAHDVYEWLLKNRKKDERKI